MSIWIALLLFAIGIVLVVKGGDWFVDAASWMARAAKIPPFLIGATIVSFATTLPELIVSVMASLEGKNDMAVGNAVGSVTANLGLIMAIALLFMSVSAPRKQYWKQCLLLAGTAAVLWIGCLSGKLQGWAIFVLIGAFALSMAGNVVDAKRGMSDEEEQEVVEKTPKAIARNIAIFVIGAAGIVLGSNLLIEGGSEIAELLGVPERVIAVTMVAIGTSLPELVTTLTAIRKKQANLSVGNILGANIIDLALILPVCSIVSGGSFSVSAQCLNIDFPACLLLVAIAIVPLLLKEKGYKLQGALMLVLYVAYLVLTVA
jgi:cation:H+ antiporter